MVKGKPPKCPECGKRVLDIRKYSDGGRFYVHRRVIKRGWPHLEGCYVSSSRATARTA